MGVLAFGKEPSGDENPDFASFWNDAPPRMKIAKGDVRRAWMKLRPSRALIEKMRVAIRCYEQSRAYREGYVVSLAKWIRDERWEDHVETAAEQEAFRLTSQKVRRIDLPPPVDEDPAFPALQAWLAECRELHGGSCGLSLSKHRMKIEQQS